MIDIRHLFQIKKEEVVMVYKKIFDFKWQDPPVYKPLSQWLFICVKIINISDYLKYLMIEFHQ